MCLGTILLTLWASAAAPSGQVAYVSDPGTPAARVCVVDIVSGVATPVGPGRGDGDPAWSPDGSRLAFETSTDGGESIAVVGADGSGLRILAHARPWNSGPQWSADGTRIAYTSRTDTDHRVSVYDLNTNAEAVWGGTDAPLLRPVWIRGSALVTLLVTYELLTAADAVAYENLPQAILAIGLRQGPAGITSELFGVLPDRTVPLPLSGETYFEWNVSAEPKGRSIAYESNDGGDREIYVARAGKGMSNVSNHREADWNPVWSRDGKWIAFESFRSGRRGVYRTFPETSRVYPVAVADQYDCWDPAWSPDGRWLTLVAEPDGHPAVYVCPLEGGELMRLSPPDVRAAMPAWRPKEHP